MSAVPGVDIAAVILAHAVGDYLLQSDWMAETKTRRSGLGWWAAFLHGVTYTVPFLLLTTDPAVLAVIAGTHVLIDHWRVARYVVWAKNWLAPTRVRRGRGTWEPRIVIEGHNPPWSKCTTTGYPDRRPAWMTTWLLIIADNIIHVVIAVAALYWASA